MNAPSIVLSTARARMLSLFGVPNSTGVELLERKIGRPLLLESGVIEARAEDLGKLFHPVTLPIPLSYHALSPSCQEGLKMVGVAMQFLSVPHRLQSNPYGVLFEQLMQTPAYAPLVPFYRRFAGPFNFLQPDSHHQVHCFLPGWEEFIRPPGGGMYPPEITTAEAFHLMVSAESSDAKDQRVIFGLGQSEELAGTPYSVAFADWLQPAAGLLQGAAVLFEGELPQIAGYLRSVANAFLTNDFPSSDRAWVGLTDGPLDMNIGAIEQYMDKLRNQLAQFLGVLQIKNPDCEQELAPLIAAFPIFEENLPVPEEFKKPREKRTPPPVFVVDSLFATGHHVAGGHISVAYNRPNDPVVRREYGRRIVIMENLLRARELENPGAKVLTRFFHNGQRSLVTPQGLKLFVFFHEEAHGNGIEHVVGDPEKDARVALGAIGSTAEELRADIVGLHNANIAVARGLLSSRVLHEIYASYFHRCINTLRKGTGGAHSRGVLVALNYLSENRAFSLDDRTGEVFIDLDRMPDIISQFAADLMMMKGRGDKEGFERLYARYGEITPPGLRKIFDDLREYPVDIIVRYAFEESLVL